MATPSPQSSHGGSKATACRSRGQPPTTLRTSVTAIQIPALVHPEDQELDELGADTVDVPERVGVVQPLSGCDQIAGTIRTGSEQLLEFLHGQASQVADGGDAARHEAFRHRGADALHVGDRFR